MTVSSMVSGTLGKLARKTAGVGLSIIAHGLMSQDFATRYTSTKKYAKFHQEEIKVLKATFPSLRTKFNISDVKITNLQEEDSGETLVCKVDFSDDIQTRIIHHFDLEENSNIRFDLDPIYLVLRKSFGKPSGNKSLPPIIQFLEKTFTIEMSLVVAYGSSGNYTTRKNALLISSEHVKDLSLVTFFDFIGKGNQALAGVNAIIKGERLNSLNNESYINLVTSRKIWEGAYRFIKDTIMSARSPSVNYPLQKFFIEAGIPDIKDISGIKSLERSIIREWRNNFGGGTTGTVYRDVKLEVSIKSKKEIIFTFKTSTHISTAPSYEIHINCVNFETYIVAVQPYAGTITTSKIVSTHLRDLARKIRPNPHSIPEIKANKEFVDAMVGIVEDHNSPVNRGLITTLLM
jgi:hypothetical protein